MKKIWHICFKTQDEVLFRSHSDHNYFFNGVASALVKTDSSLYAEAEMSNHCHQIVSSSNLDDLVRQERISYSKYFNNKYCRKGPLGEPGYFSLEIDGVSHFLAAVVYTVRNSVHHGVTKTPFMYPYCSANCYFRKELGKGDRSIASIITQENIKDYIPRRAVYKEGWNMSSDGVFLRESIVESIIVETNFVTPHAFLYMLTRRSGEEWSREQRERDHNDVEPITLERIETEGEHTEKDSRALSRMLENEKGHFYPPGLTDLELCELIDNKYVPKYKKASVYLLSRQEKEAIANDVFNKFHLRSSQIRRCLAIK